MNKIVQIGIKAPKNFFQKKSNDGSTGLSSLVQAYARKMDAIWIVCDF
jgi:hypothetical protein